MTPGTDTGLSRSVLPLLGCGLLIIPSFVRATPPESAYPRLGDCVASDALTWRSMARKSNEGNPYGDGGVPVYQAARQADMRVLRDFLAKKWHAGNYLTQQNDRGDTLLHCALDPRGHPDTIRTPERDAARLQTVELLIRMGADIQALNAKHETPIQLAVLEGNEAIIRALLKEGAQVNGSYAPGDHPIQLAVARGDIPVTALLLDAGADPNPEKYEVDFGGEPLELALRRADVPMTEYLLERMAKNGQKPGWTMIPLLDPLMENPLPFPIPESRAKEAADRLTLAEMLLKAGVSPNEVHAAVVANHTGMTQLLLDAGGDPNVPDESITSAPGRMPLHDAACHANLEIVNALLAKGAKVSAACNAGRLQAIHYAISPLSSRTRGAGKPWRASDAQRVEVVKALLKAGADPKALANARWTPLHAAASMGNLEMVRLLLEAGADPNAANERGIRPLHLDAFPHGLAIARLLVEHGASLHPAPAPEMAFIHSAASRGDIDLVAFYLEKGVPVDVS